MTTELTTAEPLRFVYWVPNVSGGPVTSTLPIVRELEVEAGLDPAAVPDPPVGLTRTDPVLAGAR